MSNESNNTAKALNLTYKTPDAKGPHIVLLIACIIIAAVSAILSIVFYALEQNQAVIISGIILGCTFLCILILSNMLNWYPNATLTAEKEKIIFSYYVPGIGRNTTYEITDIDSVKSGLYTIEIKGIVNWKPAKGTGNKQLDNYKIHVSRHDKDEVFKMFEVFRDHSLERKFSDAANDITINSRLSDTDTNLSKVADIDEEIIKTAVSESQKESKELDNNDLNNINKALEKTGANVKL